MSLIVGHTVSRQKKPYPFLSSLLVIVIIWAAWYILAASDQTPVVRQPVEVAEAAVKEPVGEALPPRSKVVYSVEILKQATSKAIENYQPQKINQIFSEGETVYFYNRVLLQPIPGKIKHVWINPQGVRLAVIELNVSRQPTDTWSYLTLPPGSRGEWQLRVLAGDKVVAKDSFEVI